MGDKSFELVIPPRTILDISQYDKTVEELKLANTLLIQKLREAEPVENEMKTFGVYHSKLISMGRSQDNMKISQNDILPSNNTNILDQSMRVSDDDDESSFQSGSCSDMDDDDDQESLSDNEDDNEDFDVR